jgi:hypothetical protein
VRCPARWYPTYPPPASEGRPPARRRHLGCVGLGDRERRHGRGSLTAPPPLGVGVALGLRGRAGTGSSPGGGRHVDWPAVSRDGGRPGRKALRPAGLPTAPPERPDVVWRPDLGVHPGDVVLPWGVAVHGVVNGRSPEQPPAALVGRTVPSLRAWAAQDQQDASALT